jgi:hypothetical protein
MYSIPLTLENLSSSSTPTDTFFNITSSKLLLPITVSGLAASQTISDVTFTTGTGPAVAFEGTMYFYSTSDPESLIASTVFRAPVFR